MSNINLYDDVLDVIWLSNDFYRERINHAKRIANEELDILSKDDLIILVKAYKNRSIRLEENIDRINSNNY